MKRYFKKWRRYDAVLTTFSLVRILALLLSLSVYSNHFNTCNSIISIKNCSNYKLLNYCSHLTFVFE